MAVVPTRRVPSVLPSVGGDDNSRQITHQPAFRNSPTATITRGPSYLRNVWQAHVRNQLVLSTDQLRRISDMTIPGACTSTLMHQLTGLEWKILSPTREQDRVTAHYTALVENANDGIGGRDTFFQNLAEDVLCCQTGGFVEVVRNGVGVPISLYNVDGGTIVPSDDPYQPFMQAIQGFDPVFFSPIELVQCRWRPFPDWRLKGYNLTPIQMALLPILILGSGDQYNQRILNETIPQGLLNLGPGFDRRKAREWKEDWDAARVGGNLNDIGLVWGTEKVDFTKFMPAPSDMQFGETAFWYASLVCACYELSVLDIGLGIHRVSTGAAAEQQTALSRRRGLKALIRCITREIEHFILPEGYTFQFEDIDLNDIKTEAAIGQMRALAVQIFVQTLGLEAGVEEAKAQGLLVSTQKIVPERVMETLPNAMQARISQPGRDQTAQDSSPSLGSNSASERRAVGA